MSLLVLLVAFLVIFAVTGAYRTLSLEALVDIRTRFHDTIESHRVLALIAYVALYAAVVSLSLPGSVLFTIAGGLMFGWVAGGVAAVIAATTGAVVIFSIARTTIGSGLAARAGPQVERLQAGFCENALSYLLFLRLTPAFPFFIVNIVPALLGVPLRTFLVGTFVGIIPASFALSAAGDGLDSAIVAAQAAQALCIADGTAATCPLGLMVGNLMTHQVKIALAGMGVLALLPVAVKLWRRRHGQ